MIGLGVAASGLWGRRSVSGLLMVRWPGSCARYQVRWLQTRNPATPPAAAMWGLARARMPGCALVGLSRGWSRVRSLACALLAGQGSAHGAGALRAWGVVLRALGMRTGSSVFRPTTP